MQAHIVCRCLHPLVSVITTLLLCCNYFSPSSVVSLHYACMQSSGIIPILWATSVPNFVTFVASIAELAHGEKSCTQSLTHLAYLMPWEPKRLQFGTNFTSPYYSGIFLIIFTFSTPQIYVNMYIHISFVNQPLFLKEALIC